VARYLVMRLTYMVFLLWLASIVTFIVIQLPPGDYLSTIIARVEQQGNPGDMAGIVEQLRQQYGLDDPLLVQYFKWLGQVLQGNLGFSFDWQRPVSELIFGRLGMTLLITVLAAIVSYLIAIPVAVYSATHQYSKGDYAATFFGFIGLAVPNFMIALVALYVGFKWFGVNLTGLYSPEYADAPFSLAKFGDLMLHLPVPVLVLATGGAAGIIRVMRGSLLDELNKQYVVTARSKGLSERRLLYKYPVRVSLNPILSNLAWLLPALISGETIVAIVLGLPTSGPMLFRSLLAQDTYLSAGFLLFISALTVIGTTLSDILLVAVDPRIRMERGLS